MLSKTVFMTIWMVSTTSQITFCFIIQTVTIVGYLRIVPPDIKFEEYSLGRIAVKKDYRGQGLGRKIVQKGIDTVRSSGARSIRIEAQAHLENFYKETGFITVSEYTV